MKNNNRKPVIGLIPLWDETKDSLWMLPGYQNAVLNAGAIPITLPLTTDADSIREACDLCDGFILTGGHDVDPAVYGMGPDERCGALCPERDAMERVVLAYALEKDMPVLGICRGHQFLNAALGGTLYRHLPEDHPSEIDHRQKPPYHLPAHSVTIPENTPLARLLDRSVLPVNSRHHQAIDRLAPPLRAMAVSEDGLIEAVYMPDKHFVWGIQWHPEHSFETDINSARVFEAFIKAAM